MENNNLSTLDDSHTTIVTHPPDDSHVFLHHHRHLHPPLASTIVNIDHRYRSTTVPRLNHIFLLSSVS